MLSCLSRVLSKRTAYIGWGCISLFYMYQYVLRVTPGILTHELRQTFSMTAEQFATLGSIYLYAYAFLQIPLGFIVDRLGVKKVALSSIMLCFVGTMTIGYAEEIYMAQIGRFLVGAGSACSFMSAVKWVSDSFPEGKRAFLMGATLALGVVGALSAGTIFVTLVEAMTWRPAVLTTGWIGMVLGIFIMLFMKSPSPVVLEQSNIKEIKSSAWRVITNKRIMLYAALATGLYTPLSVLADLWGVSFLSQKLGITRADSAATVMYLYIGLGLGCLILPTLSEKFNAFVGTIRLALIVILVLFCATLWANISSSLVIRGIFLVLGFFAGGEMICFAGAVLHSAAGQTGLAIGVTNTINMLCGAVLEQTIGSILDFQWNGAVSEAGLRVYTVEQYVNAMSVLVAIIFLSVLLSFCLKGEKKAYSSR